MEVKTSYDGRMDDPSTSKVEGVEALKDVAIQEPSTNPEVQEDFVVKEQGASVDTTDKRNRNTFAAKKTVAQGMMDIALITANANQLRYLLEYQQNSPTFYLTLSMIIISLILQMSATVLMDFAIERWTNGQIAVGVSLIFKGRYDMKGKSKSTNAERINKYVVVAVFLITIINVFIAAFSISVPDTQPLLVPTSNSGP